MHTPSGRLVSIAAGVLGLLVAGVAARLGAAAASTSLAVSATVVNNCTISTAPLAFGNYDPIGANAASSLDGSASITVACTKGATATIGLNTGDNGTHAVGSTRALQAAGAYLSYEIYKDSGHAQLWGNTGAQLYDTGAAPSKTARAFTAYGQISASQDIPAGSYTDTVTATVNF